MSDLYDLNDALVNFGGADDSTEQYLSFTLGEEEYGVEILRVQEIKGWDKVTMIPNTPHYLCGVLNLRGAIVPVVDLRLRFGMPARPYTATTVVIVLKVEEADLQRTVGIVVDAVSDAHNVKPELIKPSPDFGDQVNTASILGLVSIDETMMMILDVDHLLSTEAIG
jgi:purine-binding chemotaxis protein CheW